MKKYVYLDVITNECFYTQSPQKEFMRMSLLNRVDENSFKELHYGVTCREFFGDTLLLANADIDGPRIYGLRLDRGARQALDETIISLKIDPDKRVNLIKGLKFLREAERLLGVSVRRRTKCYHTEAERGIPQPTQLVLVSPIEWQHSPVLLSLYSLFLRFSLVDRDESIVTFQDFFRNYQLSERDLSLTINFYGPGVGLDLNLLLKNYKEIFGEDRLTGMNDADLIANLKNRAGNIDTCSHVNLSLTTTEEEYGVNPSIRVSWDLYMNHGNSGISTFAFCLRMNSENITNPLEHLITRIKGGYPPHYFGLKWIIKYLLIKERECRMNT